MEHQPAINDPDATIIHGNSLDVLPTLDANSIDSCITDPPYELGFMGKSWDASGIAYNVDLWREVLRVLKPGAHLLAFGGTRTYHRMAVAIEDAGFEVRDCLQWLYGSGFPKSLDVSKAIDKAAGAEREQVPNPRAGKQTAYDTDVYGGQRERTTITPEPATDAAREWHGWGTALKPANEPIILARKPLAEKTVAANAQSWGVGGLNIDACRIGTEQRTNPPAGNKAGGSSLEMSRVGMPTDADPTDAVGRWPANVILDEAAAAAIDQQSGETKSPDTVTRGGNRKQSFGMGAQENVPCYGDKGGASRFFYTAKASKAERNEGTTEANVHPTVKPVDLIRYLIRLVTPDGGTILDPFIGSGTTAVAARAEGAKTIGIELTEDYIPIISGRLSQQALF